MPTATTLPLLLLIGLLWRLTRGNLLAIVAFVSIFDAASALNFGQTGLAPWIFALGLCLVIKLLRGHRPVRLKPTINTWSVVLVTFFIVYAMASSIMFPVLFRGTMVMHEASVAPLAWSQTNAAQLCYLIAVGAVYFLAITRSREELAVAMQWYVRACVVAAMIGLYQLANAMFHIPYPSAVLYSNPSHMIYPAYRISGFWRLNSTFPEASEMAGYLALGVALLGWQIFTQPLRFRSISAFGLLIALLLLTFSSTGYLSLLFCIGAAVVLYGGHLIRGGGITPSKLVLCLALMGGVTAAFLFTNVGTTVNAALTSTIFEKKNSDSYRARVETHGAALDAASRTYYLGAGWGSTRPSGLFYVLIGNVGIFGTGLFACFCFSLYWPLLKRQSSAPAAAKDQLYGRTLFGMTVMLLAMLIAGAEPVIPILWMLFGVATTSYRSGQPAIRSTSDAHKNDAIHLIPA